MESNPQFRQDDRILFVDPESLVCAAFRRAIGRLDNPVDIAHTVPRAVALASAHSFAIVVMDADLCDAEGRRALERLQAVQPSATYIHLVSPQAAEMDKAERGVRLANTISKPWHDEEMFDVIRSALRVRSARNSSPLSGEVEPMQVLLVGGEGIGADVITQNVASVREPICFVQVETLASAVEQLESGSFDAVLSDAYLPDGRGLDTVTRLLSAAPTSVPVLMMTESPAPRFAATSIAIGAHDCLERQDLSPYRLQRALSFAVARKQSDSRLQNLAHLDGLTGLANRATFRRAVANAIRRFKVDGKPFAMLLVNLDRFKTINDSFGQDGADMMVKELAERLKHQLRDGDTLARPSGDEFAILVEDVERDDPAKVAESLLAAIGEPMTMRQTKVYMTAAIGIATYPDTSETVDDLLQAADAAMSLAKKGGRNGVRKDLQCQQRSSLPKLRMEGDLRHAIAAKEFILHYQPQFCMRTGALMAVEALIRWKRGDRLVSPGEFVPVLEESGLIVQAGEWILEEAASTLRTWMTPGAPPLRMSVNISAKQFNGHGLKDAVEAAVKRWQIPAGALELEITENLLMQDVDHTAQTLAELRAHGVRIAVDDFGTGYSSLSYLHRFPVDLIKIDRAFVKTIDTEEQGGVIAASITALGHQLGMEVIAEGVETTEQLRFLIDEGCDFVQGFLLGKPQPAESVYELIRRCRAAETANEAGQPILNIRAAV